MRQPIRILLALGSCIVATLVCMRVVAAQSEGGSGSSLTDSPYKNGPPPISGGYTDTSQGGTKTSGDMPVAPPRASGQDAGAKSGQRPKSADPGQAGEAALQSTPRAGSSRQ